MKEQILARLISGHDAEDAGNWKAPCAGLRFDPTLYTPDSYASELVKTLVHIFGPNVRIESGPAGHQIGPAPTPEPQVAIEKVDGGYRIHGRHCGDNTYKTREEVAEHMADWLCGFSGVDYAPAGQKQPPVVKHYHFHLNNTSPELNDYGFMLQLSRDL